MKKSFEKSLVQLHRDIIHCQRCPRLVTWRQEVAVRKVKRFMNETYWGKPVPGFGDEKARMLIVGLAPAAHGANRTGRIFTGDRSGDWLYRSLFKFGFANQPGSSSRNDGLILTDCYITAVAHCAPPQNKLTAEEKTNCLFYLQEEMKIFSGLKVIVALGKIAFDSLLKIFREFEITMPDSKPHFAHGAESLAGGEMHLIASYHPSQQNTFTGRLTQPMFDAIFDRAKTLLS